jgi:hypothetical protein
MKPQKTILSMLVGFFIVMNVQAESKKKTILPDAKVYIASMPESFDAFLKTAMEKKRVPLVIVDSRKKAAYEITGTSKTQETSTARKILHLSWHSDEHASVSITDLKSGEIVFAYSVNKKNSARGKQRTAEACAKHIKDFVSKR